MIGMRISELAALAGVSTRTVRHYHHLGLLPEPVRLANGYREYRLRDAVALARVRRLAELGLSLDEIRDVLADDQGRELREVLLELDADLARQRQAIDARRERLAALLTESDLRADSMVSPDMAAVLRDLPTDGSKLAELDRELLVLVDGLVTPEDRTRVLDVMRSLAEPDAVARGHALYAQIDELAGADVADPRVAALAGDLADHLADRIPEELAALGAPPGHGPAADIAGGAWLGAMYDEVSPAQAEVFRLLMTMLKERA
jgi:DNA-binding transcriptional MerR regulator